jgi:hypothetical protein
MQELTLTWTIDDIRAAYVGVSKKQAGELLDFLDRQYDAETGITWDVIETSMDILGIDFKRR